MATFNFNTSLGQTLTFAAASDVLNIGYPIADVSLAQVGANTVVTVANVGSVTLSATTIGQLHSTGTAANIAVSGGTLLIGDETVSDALDSLANTTAAITAATNALVYGMGGGDTLDVSGATTGNVIVFGGTGTTDTTDGGDTINASGTGNATVYGNAGNDTITLGATTTGKAAIVFGGLDADTVNLGAAAVGSTVNVNLGAGNDTLATAIVAGTLTVTGGTGDDIIGLTTVTGDTTVYGGSGETDTADGADTITLGANSAVVFANAGNDTITLLGKALGTQSVNAGAGNDVITAGGADAGAYTVTGGIGTDTITLATLTANTTSALIYGGTGLTDTADGADTISVTQGTGLLTTTIYGNAGNDTITYNAVGDQGATTNFNATINGGLGDDSITASNVGSNDVVTVDVVTGNDTVTVTFADNGNGTADGAVTVSNFTAADVVSVDFDGTIVASALTVARGSSSVVIDSGTAGSIVLGSYLGNLTAANFTNVDGGAVITNWDGAAATLTGGTGADLLVAGNNGDRLVAGTVAAAEQLLGGNGNDTFVLVGGTIANTDTITGGTGTDTIEIVTTDGVITDANLTNVTGVEKIVITNIAQTGDITLAAEASESGIVTVDGTAQTAANAVDVLTLGAGYAQTLFTFLGGAGNDVVTATANGATETVSLDGGAGADTLTGGAAIDTISGGAGADSLIGGAAVDVLTGAAGADTIVGGTGAESLSGGADADTFSFAAGDSGQAITTNALLVASLDTITDWSTTDDVLSFTNQGTETFTAQSTSQATINLLNAGAGAATLLEAVTAIAGGDGSTNAIGTAFQFGGATYAFVDNTLGAFAATDILVKIDGLQTLAVGDFATFV